jgi:dUTPase
VCGKWVNLIKTDKLDEKDRNNNGFGSTGIW